MLGPFLFKKSAKFSQNFVYIFQFLTIWQSPNWNFFSSQAYSLFKHRSGSSILILMEACTIEL